MLSVIRGMVLADPESPMRWKPSRSLLLSLVVVLLALVLAMYGARVSPADSPQPRPTPVSLSAARFFVLLPDGRVEITDAWSRRVFRWDGHRWLEMESLPRPQSDSR
jgi:peptidoglycan/LPS O-acetylase OafA/YrhL